MTEPKLPTKAEALTLLSKSGCPKNVIEHCQVVSKFSLKIAKAYVKKDFSVDVGLVEISGLLHDIGRSKTHTVNHGLIGGEIARSLGLSSSIARVIERHVGGGIPKEEAKLLGWPVRDYLPQTLEEKIVCYADKRVEGLRTIPIEKAIRPYEAMLGKNHPAIGRIMKLHEEISSVIGDQL